MEGQGTPDQPQAGSGEPTRDTTLRTSVHTQMADEDQGTLFNTYSPFRGWVDLEAGATAAQAASSMRAAAGGAAGAAVSTGELQAGHERQGAAFTAPTNLATPSRVVPPPQRVAAPITATLFGKVNFLTPHYLENYDDRQQKLNRFGRGAGRPLLRH